jgi:parallel beta-helix repeat protein
VTESSVHDCQLNGITGVEPATNLRVLGNTVTGLRSAQPGFAHPGIALGWDAKGSIEGNSVTNFSFPTCNSVSDCDFSSTGILVFFTTANIRIAGNVVGKTNTGIFVLSPNVSVLDNEVFDTDVFDGIALIGDHNIIKDNVVTNSDESGVFIQGANNLTLNNTINDASVGLLVTAGNHFLGNRFFNTPMITELFVPQAPAATGNNFLRRPLVSIRATANN